MSPVCRALVALLPMACTALPVVDDTDSDPVADTDPVVRPSDTDLPADTDPPCTVRVDTVSPNDLAEGVRLGAVIEVGFDGPVPEGRWSVAVDGVAGGAALDEDGQGATFTPDAALTPETIYTVQAAACDVGVTTTFTTAKAPVDALELVGRTWVAPWSQVTFTEPAGASLFASFVEFDAILIEAIEADLVARTLQVMATGADRFGQSWYPYTSSGLAPVEMDFRFNPWFETGGGRLEIPVEGTIIPTTVQLGDVRFTGTFVDDGDRIEGLAGEAVLDTRSLDPLVQTVLGGATI
ncbi:MAG: Ig-like domain-containing protein, partial [Myxococcales bacterium]|nr:Ig-like domain-containing protein [Myxococcales bacterium]